MGTSCLLEIYGMKLRKKIKQTCMLDMIGLL